MQDIKSQIYANNLILGEGVVIEENCKIGSPDNPIDSLVIGDNVFIGHDSIIQSPDVTILDYTKIHNHAFVFGRSECYIGYNCWFGQNCIVDCEGGVKLGNGLGSGAYSQLWSHIRHGDMMIGNQYLSFGKLETEEDVWFVGHCIVSPIYAAKQSMAMVGSVVTKDMAENRIYGGAPAKDLTDKIGTPFKQTSTDDRINYMRNKWDEFCSRNLDIPKDLLHLTDGGFEFIEDKLEFDVVSRTYIKRRNPFEVRFMKFLLPEAKFIPHV